MKYNSHRLLKHTLSLFYILDNRCPEYVFCFSTQIYVSLEHTKIRFLDENARIYKKNMPNVLSIQKEFLPLQPQKRKTLSESKPSYGSAESRLGQFVYRLGRKIFILERGVRFPHGLQIKIIKEQN